jgi:2,3-bisphosphoglycerate-independent phosphoglycerate mutase
MKPIVLCVLDGWGESSHAPHNAIAQARTPNWDYFIANYPHTTLDASASAVGLPAGQMGNSEVGHMTIGAGRIIYQDLPRIDQAIANGELATNTNLLQFIEKLKGKGSCHLMGLLSPGGVHSHQNHLVELCRILESHGIKVYVHAFLDGRDTPPKSALGYLKEFGNQQIASIGGRYFGMDRDKRWDRVETAYQAIVLGNAPTFVNPLTYIEQNYQANITDEFIPPAIANGYAGIQDGDGILVANFRADRVRQLLTALTDPNFTGFDRTRVPHVSAIAGMTQYSETLAKSMITLFPPQHVTQSLGEVVSHAGLKQLRIAETEKYAHVTFFFNGGAENLFTGEDRILVPSPKVATYDLQPEMSAPEVTDKLVNAIESDTYDFIVVNFANTDMVGHSGILEATVKAVECVDVCLGRLYKAIEAKGGLLMITADHGNAETMQDPDTHEAHTAHTTNPVPLLLINNSMKESKLQPGGGLADIAPTILSLMHLPIPTEMTGHNLISASLEKSLKKEA